MAGRCRPHFALNSFFFRANVRIEIALGIVNLKNAKMGILENIFCTNFDLFAGRKEC